jgi:hypothetical protein
MKIIFAQALVALSLASGLPTFANAESVEEYCARYASEYVAFTQKGLAEGCNLPSADYNQEYSQCVRHTTAGGEEGRPDTFGIRNYVATCIANKPAQRYRPNPMTHTSAKDVGSRASRRPASAQTRVGQCRTAGRAEGATAGFRAASAQCSVWAADVAMETMHARRLILRPALGCAPAVMHLAGSPARPAAAIHAYSMVVR